MQDERTSVRALSKILADPRVRMAAATASVHVARLAKQSLERRWKKGRSKALRRALESVVDTLQETATNWLIGPPDVMLRTGKKRARGKKGKAANLLRGSSADRRLPERAQHSAVEPSNPRLPALRRKD